MQIEPLKKNQENSFWKSLIPIGSLKNLSRAFLKLLMLLCLKINYQDDFLYFCFFP